MKYFLTGATGFIGGRVAQQLIVTYGSLETILEIPNQIYFVVLTMP